ncbi:YD repeat protein [Geotalea uraniireducens Rf4]|uniref:YD repeat protein n=2 Tax=Geotalea uraniireducens TaxID=351604 RepID=A5GAN3_GEOUR|nr:YD repeat protein [Geotalea uraniireducens Rf4]
MALSGLATETGWSSIMSWSGPTLNTGSPTVSAGYDCLTGDFDGDGKTDLTCWGGSSTWYMALSSTRTGAGWQTQNWAGPTLTFSNVAILVPDKCITGDFNGDGKTALACFDSGAWTLALSTGRSWEVPSWNGGPAISPNLSIRDQCIWGDFNGDGVTDAACYTGASPYNWNMTLSISNAWMHQDLEGPILQNSHVGYQCLTGDFNGDGKTDFACLDNYGSGSGGTWNVALSYGTGWYQKYLQWEGPAPKPDVPVGRQCTVGDFDGNGKTDVACYSGIGGAWNVALSYDDHYWTTDLLTSIYNGLGSKTDIEYWPSTASDPNIQLPWLDHHNPRLPFPVHTVHSVTTCDNYTSSSCVGNSSVTNYSFAGGFYQIYEHDFRGFNYAKVTGPAGPDGEQKIVETWFHQGDDLAVDANDPGALYDDTKGKPYRTRVSGIANGQALATYSEVETTYTTVADAYHVAPGQIDIYCCADGVSGACKGSTNARHTQTSYTYDQYGNVKRENQYGDVSDPTDDRTVLRGYVQNQDAWIVGLLSSETVYQGIGLQTPVSSTNYDYDGATDCSTYSPTTSPVKGNLTRAVRWYNGGTNTETWTRYDGYGNPVCSKDANDNITRVSYDNTFTFPKISTNPLEQPTTTQYYGVDGVPADYGLYGQIKSITDPNNAVTSYEYDRFGRRTKANRPNFEWTEWRYNSFGTVGYQHVRVNTSAGFWSEDYFDGLGRTFKERKSGPDAKTIVADTRYDRRGAVAQASLPYFEGTETPRYKLFTYDPMGRVTQATSPDPNIRILSCFDEGVMVTIDPNNHRKRESRDVYGRLVKVEEYTGTYAACSTEAGTPYATTSYSYDVLGNLRFVTDTKGNQTEMRYDTLGRKYYMKDPDMGAWSYGYAANGNLTAQTDADSQTIRFTYDPLNRITLKDYPSGTDVVYTYDESFSSNPLGRLTTMTDESGNTKYFYDSLGRITKTVKTVDGKSYTIEVGYTKFDRIWYINYPDTEQVLYEYDTGGNIYKVGNYATFTNYNALGQPGSLNFGNGVSTIYQYYPLNNRLYSITTNSPTQGLINLSYGYDNQGNITSITDHLNASIPHNFTGRSFTLYPGKAHAYGITGTGFQYGPSGNMTNNGQYSILYTYDNMPRSIGGAVSYVYDGNGSRVKKITPATTRTYLDKFYECVGDVCGKYIFAGNTRIVLKSSLGTYYYHQDHLGSTVAATDTGGNKAENIAYYPFGESRSDTGSTGVIHKYTSQELDYETGLYNYNARLYYPEIGRFITADTIVPDYANPQSLNRYAYVQNNPMNYVDPTGHEDIYILRDVFELSNIQTGPSLADTFIEDLPGDANGLYLPYPYLGEVNTGTPFLNSAVNGVISDFSTAAYYGNITYSILGLNNVNLQDLSRANDYLTAGSLALMLFPPTAPFGAAALTTTGLVGVSLGVTEGIITSSANKILSSAAEFSIGMGAGRLARRVAGLTAVKFNFKASRYYSEATGRFVRTSTGLNSSQLKEGAGAISSIPFKLSPNNDPSQAGGRQ